MPKGFQKGDKHTEEWKKMMSLKMRGNKYNLGKKHSEETKRKISEANKGGNSTSFKRGHKRNLGHKVSKKTRIKIKEKLTGYKHSEEARKNMSKGHSGKNLGKNHHNWKGGITPINKLIRKSPEYKLWRKAVFERDRFTCVWCGIKNKTIQADHIKPFSLFP